MQEIINVLESKYNILFSNWSELKQTMVEQDREIKMVKEALEHPDKFDENDIDELLGMLTGEDRVKLTNIRLYLKLFDQFKNQPQIIKAKEIYEEIKIKLIGYFEKEYNEITVLFKETEGIATFIKNMIDKLNNYNDESYIEATNLFGLTDLLRNSDVTPAMIDFYKQVLCNNIKLQYLNEETNISIEKIDLELNKYINRLRKINKILMHDTLQDDELIYKLLNDMLDTNKRIDNDADLCNHIIGILTNEIGIKEGKRLKFLIHLYFVGIDYVPEQIEFICRLKQRYNDKISNNCNKDIIKRNTEFIDIMTSTKLFDNIELLNNVFKENEVSPLDMLKIITGVIYQNEQRYKGNKQKVKQQQILV